MKTVLLSFLFVGFLSHSVLQPAYSAPKDPPSSEEEGVKESPALEKNILASPETSPPEPSESNLFKLRQIVFESSMNRVKIKMEGSGGFSRTKEEKMQNPGRLLLEIPQVTNATNLSLNQLTDKIVVPRIRLAQHPDRLRIIIDTVLKDFPNYSLQKTDQEIVLTFEKTSEMLEEAKRKTDLFAAMQRGDREALLKLGSEDEGGILFAEGAPAGGIAPQTNSTSPRIGLPSQKGGDAPSGFLAPARPLSTGGVRIEPISGATNRIVFVLDDRKAHKIFIEGTQTPIHIQRIRPVHEVKGIQSRLNLMGYDSGHVDGAIGPRTRSAVRRFQKDHQLRATGEASRKTQKELQKVFGY